MIRLYQEYPCSRETDWPLVVHQMMGACIQILVWPRLSTRMLRETRMSNRIPVKGYNAWRLVVLRPVIWSNLEIRLWRSARKETSVLSALSLDRRGTSIISALSTILNSKNITRQLLTFVTVLFMSFRVLSRRCSVIAACAGNLRAHPVNTIEAVIP